MDFIIRLGDGFVVVAYILLLAYIVMNLLPLLPGGNTAVAFRFAPYGDGDWTIDDVYVDPWRHG